MKKHTLTSHQIHILCSVVSALEAVKEVSFLLACEGPGIVTMSRGNQIGEIVCSKLGAMDWLFDDLGLVRADAYPDIVTVTEDAGDVVVDGPEKSPFTAAGWEKKAPVMKRASEKKVVTKKGKKR